MIFKHAEPPLEGEEVEFPEAVIEVRVIFEPEVPIDEPHENVPQNHCPESEMENQEEEDLAEILPNRIP